MGCQTFTTAGVIATFTWPDGVDRAVVYCVGGGAGGSVGTPSRGGAGGGGGAFAERLVTKTDATASVYPGRGGAGGSGTGNDGADGENSYFSQASSLSSNEVEAVGGSHGNGPSGGTGGLAASSNGSIKYNGGNGGFTGTGDGGGGGGGQGCSNQNGYNGDDDDGLSSGGLGGKDCSGGYINGGGDGGDDTLNGHNGNPGFGYGGAGGGGGGTDSSTGGNGGGGYVVVCWEDPIPTGYCVDGTSCNRWWPACGQYGYGGRQCFYYGYPYFPSQYGYSQGWELACCIGKVQPSTLTLTIIYLASYTETFRMFAVNQPNISGVKIAYQADPWRGDGTSLYLGWSGGTCALYCWDGVTLTTKVVLDAFSCDPVFLARQMPLTMTETPQFTCSSNGNDHTFIITE